MAAPEVQVKHTVTLDVAASVSENYGSGFHAKRLRAAKDGKEVTFTYGCESIQVKMAIATLEKMVAELKKEVKVS